MPAQNRYDQSQENFKKFTLELLNAQEYDFMDEGSLFTPESLRRILRRFCNIIAKFLNVESCTIQLQLRDWNELPTREYFDKELRSRVEVVAKRSGWTDSAQSNRERLWRNSLVFPYWHFPKGGVQLVAANTSENENEPSPWQAIVDDDDPQRPLGLTPLHKGISETILQNNTPRIRDRLSMRSTRGMRKLGTADFHVWNNSDWRRVFKNYYGVPIRIHPGGEAVGILKVENKRFPSENERARYPEPCGEHLSHTADEIAALLEKCDVAAELCAAVLGLSTRTPGGCPYGGSAKCPQRATFSLLSLAYLQVDLEQVLGADKTGTLADLCLIPYSEQFQRSQSLRAGEGRPPVQLVCESAEDEEWLGERVCGGEQRSAASILKWYEEVNTQFAKCPWGEIDSQTLALGTAGAVTPKKMESDPRVYKVAYKHLVYVFPPSTAERERGERKSHSVHVIILPKPDDLGAIRHGVVGLEAEEALKKEILKKLEQWSGQWGLGNIQEVKDGKEWWHVGEFVRTKIENTEVEFPDLLRDRLAARVQALSNALPVPDFEEADWSRLSWAAFEIGKLIEREISYRAAHHEDAIPLTAMEFHRIPISNLSFVDAMWKIRGDARTVEKNIAHHMLDVARDMGMQNTIRYKSRVKEHRHFLLRLGERHEGYTRGNLAVLFYLLALLAECEPELGDLAEATGKFLNTDEKSFDQVRAQMARVLGRRENLVAQAAEPEIAKLVRAVRDECEGEGVPARVPKSLRILDENVSVFRYLRRFKEGVDAALKDRTHKEGVDEASKDHTHEALKTAIQRFLSKSIPDVLCDLRFVAPPLKSETVAKASNLKKLCEAIEANLDDEGLLRKVPNASQERNADLQNLIFRNYDAYAVCAGSLAIQLLNCSRMGEKGATEYLGFYESCYELRDLLSMSSRDMADHPGNRAFLDVFGISSSSAEAKETWNALVEYVDTHRTDAFAECMADAGSDPIFLNARGLYKRIRTNYHTLRFQKPPEHLTWALRRFDLFGCQINALYKNQVFALYEQLWNCGDPFVAYRTKTPETAWINKEGTERRSDEPDLILEKKDAGDRRQRWLSFRTALHSGEYVSCHIGALVDPYATDEEHWREDTYNLSLLREFLHKSIADYEGGWLRRYRAFAESRHSLRRQYVDWFRQAEKVRTGARTVPESVPEAVNWFGTFLCEGVFDFLLWVDEVRTRNPDGDAAVHNEMHKILVSHAPKLGEFFDAASKYSTAVRQKLLTENANYRIEKESALWLSATGLYCVTAWALQQLLANSHASEWFTTAEMQWLAAEEPLVREEWKHFTESHKNATYPLVYCESERTFRGVQNAAARARAFRRGAAEAGWDWSSFNLDLVKFRRGQKDFLFCKEETDKESGFCLRQEEEVLHRVLNYVLLFRKEAMASSDPRFAAWTSYDLFYYMRSLVPMEMQIRTQLSNTMQTQYHDAVYKGRPGIATLGPRNRIRLAGRDLDEVDKELEIDFEDYIDRHLLDIARHG